MLSMRALRASGVDLIFTLIFHEAYRRALTRRFPYAVFYERSEAAVAICAVFHTSRDPDKWRQRLP